MRVNHVLLISLLIVGALLVPAVSAEEIYNESLVDYSDTSQTVLITTDSYTYDLPNSVNYPVNKIHIRDVSSWDEVGYIVLDIPFLSETYSGDNCPGWWVDSQENIVPGRYDFVYEYNGKSKPGVLYLERYTNLFGTPTHARFTIFLNDWDRDNLEGPQIVTLPFSVTAIPVYPIHVGTFNIENINQHDVAFVSDIYKLPNTGRERYLTIHADAPSISIAKGVKWEQHLTVKKIDGAWYEITLDRAVKGILTQSTIQIYKDSVVVAANTGHGDTFMGIYRDTDIDTIKIVSPSNREYYYNLGTDPGDPGDPDDHSLLRTGSVTMTDNNGTTISGFDVTAVNAYTDEAFTVATDTDVAVMTLPMDRTIEIRNPQTGVYETALIGYYRFYGQSSGYKMLVEDGIQVSVMAEKYGSYQLCDIRVTSESGYLTGNHQFQIRSRADNSILQTGTISAKSATTNEWYNATVSGGIANIILPYDTSNVVSQYAGNYYVYATSPGYEDSDYGTQIVVMPHTVSEIRDILLTPIGGVPTPGNVTLRIQVFSETGSGVVNAEIFVAGVLGEGASVWDTYTASSTGYLTVSVPGNSTYDIVASGAGYYDSARRVEVLTEDPPLIEIKLYLSGAPTLEPTTQPTGWPTTQPTTQPTGGIPEEDDDSEGFLMQAVRGIGLAFGVGFSTAKLIFGMLLALSIGYATAKQLRGGAAEFGLGLLGGTLLGVLIGLLPVWIIVVLLLVVGLYIGNRYVGGANNG